MEEAAVRLLLASITEGIVFVFCTFIVLMLFHRYYVRRKQAALILALAFAFYEIAIICLFVLRVMQFVQEVGIINTVFEFGDIGINLGYAFSAVSNVLIMIFVAQVFTQSPFFRATKMYLPFTMASFNGITIGLIIGNLIRNYKAPEYQLITTAYHLGLTVIAFGSLIIFTIQPLRKAKLRWEKTGFAYIILSGVLGILIYASFTVDVFTGGGYTFFYYLAYCFAILMILFAYFGYVMPNFIRKRFPEKEDKLKMM